MNETASEFVVSGLLACIPRGCPPPFRTVVSATFVNGGREKTARAELEMFDGKPGTIEVGRWGKDSGWTMKWLSLEGGSISLEDGEWKRVPRMDDQVPPGRTYTHWISFDTANMEKARRVLGQGSGFTVERAFNHPKDMTRVVLRLSSSSPYETLDLAVNSFSSPIRRHARAPKGLGGGMEVEAFERIYGTLGLFKNP